MTDWTAGYVTDIGYTYGYYTELNPLRIKLAFLNAGLAVPDIGVACELGFGQGLSVNLHAAASVVHWHGTDFNPAQAGFAQELARVADAGAQLVDQAFDPFCARTDLPDFDYIGLHGIWSWISDANRAVIVDFIRRKLKVGGVLYLSYNTQPGWASMVPMRDLLTDHAQVLGAAGQGIIPRIDAALAFAERLFATHPGYARANPQIADRLQKIKDQNRHYLAHEYFNRDWEPLSFAQLTRSLSPAKLSHACSAHYLDYIDAINLSAEQQGLLRELPDPTFRETVRDFMVNQQFRRDYWVKGARRLTSLEQGEALRAQRILLVQPHADIDLKVTGALGEATLQETVYLPLLEATSDHRIKTLGQLEAVTSNSGLQFAQLVQATLVLTGLGVWQSVQDDSSIAKAKKPTDRLNAWIMRKSRSQPDLSYLASPVTGGGFVVGRFPQLFLLARTQSQKTPADWAAFVWRILQTQGQALVKDGRTLETAEDNVTELTAQANAFAEKTLPILKALQIV